MDNLNFEHLINDIPVGLAVRAFYNTSFSPEKRGQQYRNDYAATLQADYELFKKQAEIGGTVDKLEEVFNRYRNGYAARYRDLLSAHGRCISSMIVGPAKFPTRRAEKANAAERARLGRVIEYREKVKRAAIRDLRPDLRPIMAGDADALDRLAIELAKREKKQEAMKKANSTIRKHKANGPQAQIQALVELGYSEQIAAELIKPDFCNRVGFANFELTNNSAEIRRLKARIEQIEKMQAAPVLEKQGDGVRLEDDPPANRIRLFFDGKPNEETRANLKKNGFRWTPSLGAWQAYRNTWSIRLAASFVASE